MIGPSLAPGDVVGFAKGASGYCPPCAPRDAVYKLSAHSCEQMKRRCSQCGDQICTLPVRKEGLS